MLAVFLNEVIKIPTFRRKIKVLAIDEMYVYSSTMWGL